MDSDTFKWNEAITITGKNFQKMDFNNYKNLNEVILTNQNHFELISIFNDLKNRIFNLITTNKDIKINYNKDIELIDVLNENSSLIIKYIDYLNLIHNKLSLLSLENIGQYKEDIDKLVSFNLQINKSIIEEKPKVNDNNIINKSNDTNDNGIFI